MEKSWFVWFTDATPIGPLGLCRLRARPRPAHRGQPALPAPLFKLTAVLAPFCAILGRRSIEPPLAQLVSLVGGSISPPAAPLALKSPSALSTAALGELGSTRLHGVDLFI